MPTPDRTPTLQLERERIIAGLRDLIAALDRRLPRLDGREERPIARDAASLRLQALSRLEELHDGQEVKR